MEENRYYIAIDENGEAYIEHGLFDRARSTGQRAHKYLMKIGEGAKARYLYTQEEVRAYMQGGRRAVQNAGRNAVNTIKDKVGVNEKERAEKAWDKVPKRLSKNDPKGMRDFKLASKAQDDYRKTPLGKAEYTAERAKEIATGQDGSAKEIAQKIGNNLKSKTDRMKEEFRKKKDEVADKLGFDERQRLKEAEDYRDRTQNLGRSDNVIKRTPDGAIDFSANAKQQEKAQKDVENRRDEYHDTPIGKVAKLKENAEDAIDEAKRKTNKKVEELKSQLKEQIEKIDRERDFKNAPKTFSKMIKENAKNLGISEDEAKERLIEWTTEYYTNTGDLERRDRYLEALRKA